MFDGVVDQFHQIIAPPRTSSSLPLHLSFPLHASSPTPPNNNTHTATFPTTPFDSYNDTPSHHFQLQQSNPILHHPKHHHNLEIPTTERERQQLPQLIDSCWTHDEVLALFRIRSTMDTWFPDLTWEHVSRKLADLGFKRSAEKCKEKFEEESRYLNNNINYNDNYRFLSEFEQELYEEDQVGHHNPDNEPREGQQDKTTWTHALEQPYSTHDTSARKPKDVRRKRKKQQHDEDKFEVFKGFCENVVNKMMAQQEEMHNKLLEDMIKRDEEKFAREDAWKKQEIDRMNKELEMMAREQAVAGNRQATVLEFLKKLASTSHKVTKENPNLDPVPPSYTMALNHQDSATCTENPSSSVSWDTQEVPDQLQNPSSVNSVITTMSTRSEKGGEVGRRWPRDEVLALINLRCSVSNNSRSQEKEGNSNKAPLWEKISQGMLKVGYKRTAKRCKEKWENINKYFRKTKDVKKKRSLDSRTCPYFHHLTTLYTQGKLVSQSEIPQNIPEMPQADPSSQVVHVNGGEKIVMQLPEEAFDVDQPF